MDEYLCVTLYSRVGESEVSFKNRLSDLWTHLLRQHEELFEKVYAETSAFEKMDQRLSRKYLVEAEVAEELEPILVAQALDFEPIDPADIYSKFEAAPPDWFWIEH